MENGIIFCKIELLCNSFTNLEICSGMKKQEIISVLYELHKITGFRMSLHDINFVEIAAYPEEKLPICAAIQKAPGEYERCMRCDKEAFKKVQKTKDTVIYRCHHGLTEAVSPLYNFGILTGYLMMGQICDDSIEKSEIKNNLLSLSVDSQECDKLINSMRTVPEELTHSYFKIMTVCAQYLTLSNAMPGAKPTIAESAKRYIYENLNRKITIKEICNEVGCSKTTLISTFKKEFGTTVNIAITDAKLEEAKKLLLLGKMSINEIASATGFYDQSYFSKVFSSKYGMPPSEFRKDEAI